MFGLSFGSNKQSTTQNTTRDTTGTQNQTGVTAQNQTNVTSGTTNTNTTGTTTGDNRSQTAGTTSSSTTGQQNQAATSRLFSDTVLQALETAGLGQLARAQQGVDTSSLAFDPAAFVSDAVTRAQVSADRQLGAAQGSLYDSIGGTAGGNTMAAILAQELNSGRDASIAGARNDAVAAANEIQRQNINTELAARGQEVGLLDTIIGSLRGGATTSTAATTTSEQAAARQEQIGNEQTSQTQQQSQQQQTQQVSQLIGLIQQIISGTTTERTNESVDATTKKGGFGFGLGL